MKNFLTYIKSSDLSSVQIVQAAGKSVKVSLCIVYWWSKNGTFPIYWLQAILYTVDGNFYKPSLVQAGETRTMFHLF